MRKLFFALLILIPSTLLAQPACNFDASVDFFGAVLNNQDQVLAHEFQVIRRPPSPPPFCGSFRVYAGKGNTNSYERRAYSGSFSVRYNLVQSANSGNILKDYPDAGPGEYLSGSLSSNDTPVPTTFYVTLPDLISIFSTPPGVYTDVVPFHVYSVSNSGDVTFRTSRYMTLSIQIPRYTELSLVPTQAPHDPSSTVYTMDFGQLSSQSELSADLIIVGNVGFSVMMSSQNGSRLVNQNSHVSYQLKIADQSYRSLSPAGSLHQVAMRTSGTSPQGQRYPLRVRLGQVANDLAKGVYQDQVTITVQAW